MKVYLAGPMTGYPNWNYDAFDEWEEILYLDGFEVLNPTDHFDGDQGRERPEYMRESIADVLKADAVAVLEGWENSDGARREVDVARAIGIPVYDANVLHLFEDMTWAPTVETGPPTLTFTDKKDEVLSPRESILTEARELITGDRNNAYGPPTQDFQRTADAATAYGYRGPEGRDLQPHDVAVLVMLVKLSRLMWSPTKRDHWVDLAGYAGCGGECALEENHD